MFEVRIILGLNFTRGASILVQDQRTFTEKDYPVFVRKECKSSAKSRLPVAPGVFVKWD